MYVVPFCSIGGNGDLDAGEMKDLRTDHQCFGERESDRSFSAIFSVCADLKLWMSDTTLLSKPLNLFQRAGTLVRLAVL